MKRIRDQIKAGEQPKDIDLQEVIVLASEILCYVKTLKDEDKK